MSEPAGPFTGLASLQVVHANFILSSSLRVIALTPSVLQSPPLSSLFCFRMASWFSRVTRRNTEGDTENKGQESAPNNNNNHGFGSFFSNVATKIMTTLAEEKERFMNEREDEGHLVTPTTLPLWMALSTEDERVAGISFFSTNYKPS